MGLILPNQNDAIAMGGAMSPNGMPMQQIDMGQVIANIAAQVFEQLSVADVNIKYKKLHDDAKVPTYGTDGAACADLYAYIPEGEVTVYPHQTVKIGTGLAFDLPDRFVGLIYARSGLATKEGLRPANAVGVCDADYKGEYIIAMHNDSHEPRIVKHGDRIGQVMFMPIHRTNFVETQTLTESNRSNGGFGSTGK